MLCSATMWNILYSLLIFINRLQRTICLVHCIFAVSCISNLCINCTVRTPDPCSHTISRVMRLCYSNLQREKLHYCSTSVSMGLGGSHDSWAWGCLTASLRLVVVETAVNWHWWGCAVGGNKWCRLTLIMCGASVSAALVISWVNTAVVWVLLQCDGGAGGLQNVWSGQSTAKFVIMFPHPLITAINREKYE